MYQLDPAGVFAHERVFQNPLAVQRMERMLESLGMSVKDVPVVNVDDLEEVLSTAGSPEELATEDMIRGGHGRMRQGHFALAGDPVLVFNTFVWDEAERLRPTRQMKSPHGRVLQALFGGVGEDWAFSRRELETPGRRFVCQGGWGIHTLTGCVHKCSYCQHGFVVNLMLDIEEFRERVAAMFRRRPEQLLYRYDLNSDVLAFEPEYGASAVLARCFAEHDKYLLLYTRSNNVEWLADLPYREHLPINWTISMETQTRELEPDSPSLRSRVEAMRFCQQEGFPVRAGFSPVIPIADWREESTQMLEHLFSQVQPEVVRAWVLAMMEADEFERIYDVAKMDQKFVRRMREEADELAGLRHAPFPIDVRVEIYSYYIDEIRRISPETPFAICSEAPEVWDELESGLAMTRDNMFCCCGGLSAPGPRR